MLEVSIICILPDVRWFSRAFRHLWASYGSKMVATSPLTCSSFLLESRRPTHHQLYSQHRRPMKRACRRAKANRGWDSNPCFSYDHFSRYLIGACAEYARKGRAPLKHAAWIEAPRVASRQLCQHSAKPRSPKGHGIFRPSHRAFLG